MPDLINTSQLFVSTNFALSTKLDWYYRTLKQNNNTNRYVWNEFQIMRNEISAELIAISFEDQ